MTHPAPRKVQYVGRRVDGTAIVTRVSPYIDGVAKSLSKLNPRFDLANHSPTGFEWAYEGSGPAQLALALVADATGDATLACRVYQQYKREVVSRLSHDGWTLEAGDIADAAHAIDDAQKERGKVSYNAKG